MIVSKPNQIRSAFTRIRYQMILTKSRDIQQRLKVDKSLEQSKNDNKTDWVTAADFGNQRTILHDFSTSLLKGTYLVKSEEFKKRRKRTEKMWWQLIIDPLDGTTRFRKGEALWGVMVGACDENGVLIYSWNLVSTGDVFKTEINPIVGETIIRRGLREKIQNGERIKIDVYDYDTGVKSRFGTVFEDVFQISPNQYEQTAFPAAVWAGWELFQGKLDGLLWLPSDKGKKWYPDYDLIFLGVVAKCGFQVKLGKIAGKNAMIVIAPTVEEVDKLCTVGMTLLNGDQRNSIVFASNPLQITEPL